MVGDQSKHHEIRARVIEYMRDNAANFKAFIDVAPGGGVRRNPKRKNAGSFTSNADSYMPTEEDINRVFEAHLAQMAKGGTYGDNMEIVAFSEAYGVDVKIYQETNALMVSGSRNKDDGKNRPIMHIAYHVSLNSNLHPAFRFRRRLICLSRPGSTIHLSATSAALIPVCLMLRTNVKLLAAFLPLQLV